MKRLDTQTDMLKQMNDAITEGNHGEAAKLFVEYTNDMQQKFIDEARAIADSTDAQALAQRGVMPLTQKEKDFYTNFIEAAKSAVPQQALSNLNVVLPKTTIDRVMEDIEKEHPLLSAIDFQNANGLIEILVNKGSKQLATWSKLCGKFVTELSADFAMIQLGQNKLSAFLPVCKAMLDLGPAWLDRYVRTLLSEAIAYGLEEAIVNGSGVDMPVGMNRNISADFNSSTGYPKKTAKAVTSLDPASYGAILADLAKDADGRPRKIGEVILVVNPADYFAKVMPATTLATPTGYSKDVLPYPTTVIQSEQVTAGEAIIGIANRYFVAVGIGKDGKIEYSDEYKFVDDERVYAAKLYAAGMPKDNNAFALLDISGLKPAMYKVETVTAATGAPETGDPETGDPETGDPEGGA